MAARTERFELVRRWVPVLLIFGLVLVCYWPALHGELLWDDPAHVPRPELRSWEGLRRIWFDLGATQQYYPVLFSAFWLEHRLWGDETFGYHLLNLGLHATSCCVLALLLRRLWARSAPGTAASGTATLPMPGAEWLAAAIFAVHPVFVESVAWITEQKNTLSGLLYLLAAFTYLNFASGRQARVYAVASILFLLALGAKTATATLPAALLVVIWWKQGSLAWRRDVRPLAPWFAAALVSGVFVAWVERTVIGADGASFQLSAVERVLLAGRTFWFYLSNLFWPVDLTFYYQRWDVARDSAGWAGYLVGAVAVTTILYLWQKRARGPLAGWLLFGGTMLPFLGFFNAYFFEFSYVNDHSQYLASISAIATVTGGLAIIAARAGELANRVFWLCTIAVIATLAVLARGQSKLYINNETLFRDTVAKTPDSWMGRHVLAVTLAKQGRQAESIAEYETALTLKPDHPDAHLGLAVELMKTPGRQAEAITHYERAIQLRPNYAEAHNNLGVALAAVPGRESDAVVHFETALRALPRLTAARVNLAKVLARMPARGADAIREYETVLEVDPNSAEAHFGLASQLASQPQRRDEAIAHFGAALTLNPEYAEAHVGLADLYAANPQQRSEAVAHYEQALQRKPDLIEARYNLANTLAATGRIPEAITHYEAVLRARPDFADAHGNLANALALQPGQEASAVEHYQAALRANPRLAWVHHNLALQLSRLPSRADDALRHAEEAVRLDPNFIEAYNTLAILNAQQGQLGSARHFWELALERDPSYEPARKNLRLLQQVKPQ